MFTVRDVNSDGGSGRAKPVAIVIGSGFGGLAAAVRLGARGYAVKILERLDAPGGRAYVHRMGGFTFDAGPTIVTAPFLFEELWSLCGRRLADDVELVPMKPFYKIRFPDGATFTYSSDRAAMRAEVERFSPGEADHLDAFLKMSEAIYRIGFEKLGDEPFNSILDMAKIAPELIRLQGYRSVYSVVSSFFKDERLRTVFSFHPLLIGGDPFRASSIYCLIAFLETTFGVHSAIGGTGALTRGLVGLIESQGGEIRYRADVSQILVEGGKAVGVELSDGERLRADIVVSNADSAWTYRHLVPASARRRWTDAKLNRAKYSMGLFLWYFGTDRRYDEVGHHTILMGPRYRELLKDIFRRKKLSDDFSLYLHRPTATDPSVAPPGCDAFYVLSPVPNLQGGQDWSVEAETYRQRIESWLEANLLPDLGRHIVVSKVTTPIDFRDRLNATHGEGFGLEPLLTQSAWFRPHNRSEDVKNLFLVGAGVHPGAGLPGVLSSARVLDKVAPHASAFV
ncbi:phytoene desaturase [uncultured Rhodoblastus sp.]|uniref:phytoene desaturase n=1 Tax=uncultured Rhodoblastus sp. TaxID=543037 RepID=UPI0025E56035|nr:phytoene desaturase [uncultured Rhodoblastus sp.]